MIVGVLFVFVVVAGIAAVAFILRAAYLIYMIFSSSADCKLLNLGHSLRSIICIGSGGHTTEMLRIMRNINSDKYQPRLYIIADNDISSEVKIHDAEKGDTEYALVTIPRSRNVKQSYLSSVFSTLHSTFQAIPVVYNFKPDVIFCNGPGTCVPVCVVAFLLRCLFIIDCRIVFVESICRVRTLSLTGKILQYFADIIVVQWPQLRDVCFRAKYFGRLT